MTIFLTILFTIFAMQFMSMTVDEEEFIDLRISYAFATAFMSALLFLLYKL